METFAYLSRATGPENTASLDALLQECQAFNRSVGVTGVLAYANGGFAQLIEGNSVGMGTVLRRIRASRRHRDLVVLGQGAIEHRLYTDWCMRWWLPEDQHMVSTGFPNQANLTPVQRDCAERIAKFLGWETPGR